MNFYKVIFLSICTGIIGFCYGYDEAPGGIQGGILVMILCASVPWGWKTLNKITPNVFLILPFAGWVIYFWIKFLLSICIGWIVAIPKCKSMHDKIKINKKIKNNIDRIRKELKYGIIL